MVIMVFSGGAADGDGDKVVTETSVGEDIAIYNVGESWLVLML